MATFDPRTGQVIPGGPGIIAQPGGPGVAPTQQFPGGPPPIGGPVAPGVGPQVPPQSFIAPQPPPIGGPQVPPTGLIGSEQALRGGLSGALLGLQQGLGQARSDIGGQFGQGIDALQLAQLQGLGLLERGGGQALGQIGQGIGALQQGGQQALGQIGQGVGVLQQGGQQALGQIGQGVGALQQGGQQALGQIGQGVAGLQPFISPGQQSQQLQAALSGALGADAQRQAFADFTASPGQAFLQEQGERAVLRNAAATGGLGGGNVLRELQRQGVGLAAQEFGNQFNRLGQLTGQGLQAAGQVGSLRGQGAGILGQLAGQAGQLRGQGAGILGQLTGQAGQLRGQGAGILGQLAGQAGQLRGVGAGILGQVGGQQAALTGELASQQAGLRGQAGGLLGQLGLQGGLTAAELARGTGRDLATGRTRAGEQIAGGISGTTSALADLINQQGVGLAGQFQTAGGDLAQLLAGFGQQQGAGRDQLAALLAQIRQAGTGQQAGLPGLPGVTQTPGILPGLGQAASGIGTAVTAFSDVRLKENLQIVGETPEGNRLYTWTWNDEGQRVAGRQPTLGVIAQEVPEAAFEGPDGYLMVDYARVM